VSRSISGTPAGPETAITVCVEEFAYENGEANHDVRLRIRGRQVSYGAVIRGPRNGRYCR